ncbi:hypothetical protein LCGC14_0526350 [marine sediment metagenome]|uniref:Uncharacterized protein n=1 Tax=marine sediment metagenome TaxID=412755 RepID=A0A0F9RX53_9ZZZZ
MDNTIFTPIAPSKFIVRNRVQKAVMLFGQKVEPGGSYDLMTIPYISESDIQHSLLKGTLRNKLSIGEIRVTDSNINLVQYSPEFTTFLQSIGITAGISPVSATGVANIAALSQLDDTVMSDGTTISVVTLADTFLLDKTNTQSIDGIIIVVTNSGTGRWVRCKHHSARWGEQYTWYIDADNGDDENKGDTALTALATFAECTRRMGTQVYYTAVTINILSDINEKDPMLLAAFMGYVTIQGVETTVATGTITDIVQWDHDPSDGYVAAGFITDSALSGDWSVAGSAGTSLIDKKIILTDGVSAGAYAYIIEDSGSPKEAYVSPWVNEDTWTEKQPSPGDAYKIVELPAFLQRYQVRQQNYWTYLKKLRFVSPTQYLQSLEANGNFIAMGCIFDGTYASQNGPVLGRTRGTYFVNCFLKSGLSAWSARSVIFVGSVFKNLGITHLTHGRVIIQGPLVFFNNSGPMTIPARENSMVVLQGYSLGVVCLGAQTNGSVVKLRDTSSLVIKEGSSVYSIGGSAGIGVWVSSAGTVVWMPAGSNANTVFSFESASDFKTGGTAKTIAELNTAGFFNSSNGARAVSTDD